MIEYTDPTTAIKAHEKLVLIASARWCGPCQRMMPTLNSVVSEIEQDLGAHTFVVNIEEHEDFARQHNMKGVPTFFVFHNEKLIYRESGCQNALQYKEFCERLFK